MSDSAYAYALRRAGPRFLCPECTAAPSIECSMHGVRANGGGSREGDWAGCRPAGPGIYHARRDARPCCTALRCRSSLYRLGRRPYAHATGMEVQPSSPLLLATHVTPVGTVATRLPVCMSVCHLTAAARTVSLSQLKHAGEIETSLSLSRVSPPSQLNKMPPCRGRAAPAVRAIHTPPPKLSMIFCHIFASIILYYHMTDGSERDKLASNPEFQVRTSAYV